MAPTDINQKVRVGELDSQAPKLLEIYCTQAEIKEHRKNCGVGKEGVTRATSELRPEAGHSILCLKDTSGRCLCGTLTWFLVNHSDGTTGFYRAAELVLCS